MEKEKKDILLIDCMREIPDPRAPYNQRHKFLDIIIIAVTAVLAGMDTWNEIADWAASKKQWLGTFLELPDGIPSHDTINRVFQMIEPEKFHDAFFRWAPVQQIIPVNLGFLHQETQSGSGIQQGLSVSVNSFSIHVTESTPMPLLAAVLKVVRDAQ